MFLDESFSAFLEPQCDRKQFIVNHLAKKGIQCNIIPIGESRHILVNFPLTAYNPMFRVKTVLAHYDRAEGSPGANDNSAAVFQMMDWAVRLSRMNTAHNVRLFFTDGEELGGTGGVAEQGAFGIAAKFRNLGILDDDVYVFDCCGRGDIPVLSNAGSGVGGAAFQTKFNSLVNRTKDLLRVASPNKWLSLPVPYSDNAGFLACGMPAVAITLLPSTEATSYLQSLQADTSLEPAVTRSASSQHTDEATFARLPETWRLLHTPLDNITSLTPQSFALMGTILDILANAKSLR